VAAPPARPGRSRIYLHAYTYTRANVATMRGFSESGGYLGLQPAARLNPADPLSQRVAGVSWAYRDEPEPGVWIRDSDPVARARLVTDTRLSTDPGRDIGLIDPALTALLDSRIEPMQGPVGAAAVTEDRPGRITVTTEAPSRQLLVLSERYHSGWRVEQDRHPVPDMRVDGDFQGCVVGPGRHTVTFRFQPESFTLGCALSAAGVLLAACCYAGIVVTKGAPDSENRAAQRGRNGEAT